MIDGLTTAQAKQLLNKHLTGDWLPAPNRYNTIKILINKGLLEYRAPYIYVTDKGIAWCDKNHLVIV